MAFLGKALRVVQFPLKWLFSFLLVDVLVTSIAFLLCLLTSIGLFPILWSGETPNFRLSFFGIFAHLPFGFGTDVTSRLGLWVALAVVAYLALANGLHLWRLGGRVKDWFLSQDPDEDEGESIAVYMDRVNARSTRMAGKRGPWSR